MAAVTTKKPGGDVAIELTFPAVYQEVYADSDEAERFAPSFPLAPPKFEEADDLQGAYHAQKRKDAHHMVMAAVHADSVAKARMLSSHANYFGMPKAVLSQRIYANPSLGNLSGAIDSARRTAPGSDAPFRCMSAEERSGATGGCGTCYETQMRGGVLRTSEGQNWASQKLQARVKQLDAIDAAAMTPGPLEEGEDVEYPNVADEFAPKAKLELLALLDQLENSLLGGEYGVATRFAITDLSDAIKLLIRFATVADRQEMEQALAQIDAILASLRAIQGRRAMIARFRGAVDARLARQGRQAWDAARAVAEGEEVDNNSLAEIIVPRLEAMRDYLTKMLRGINLQPKERQTLSRTLLASSPLTRFRNNVRARAIAARVADPRLAGVVDAPDFQPGGPPPPGGPAPRAPPAGPQGARFNRDQRQVFGARAGAYLGEAPQDDVPDVVNPFRRARGPARLQAVAEAPEPVFADQAAVPAAAAVADPAQVEAIRAARRDAEALVAQARAAREAIQARAAPAPQGRGRGKRAPAKKRGGMTPAERAEYLERLKATRAKAAADARAAVAKTRARSVSRPRAAPAAAAAAAPASAAAAASSGREATPAWWAAAEEGHRDEAITEIIKAARRKGITLSRKGAETVYEEKLRTTKYPSKTSGFGKAYGLTRATLPKDREGYVALAADLRGKGHDIRVNSGSQLKSIRANFIKRLGL